MCIKCGGTGTNHYPRISSAWLRAVRQYAGVSRKELAQISGYTYSYVAAVENDHLACSSRMLAFYEQLLTR